MADIKNIDVFQTVTSVTFQVEPNTDIININKVTVSGSGGNQDLQSVTDIGAATDNTITINVIEEDKGLVINSDNEYAIDAYSNRSNAIRVKSTEGNGILAEALSDLATSIVSINQQTDGTSITSYATNGTAIKTFNNTGIGEEINLGTSSKGIVINSGTSSTGNPIEINKNGVDKLVVSQAGELTATKLIKQGGTSSQFLMADGSTSTGVSGATNLTTSQTSTNFTINSDTGNDASVPLGNGTLAGATLNDYTTTEKNKLAAISGTNTGDNATNTQYSGLAASKQDNITLTTTGTSGAATLVGSTLNIPQYTGGSGGGGTLSNSTASGTDTYTTTISGVASYVDGAAYLIRFTNGNTSTATLNINSLGARTLYRNNDGVLIGGDIQSGGEMVCVYNSALSAFKCIGTSPNDIVSYVTNADSVTITKGQPVYAFGGIGDRMTVKLAYNTLDATSAQTIGLVMSASIAAGQKGLVITQGLLDGLSTLPTSTFTDGDTIYLGATAGTITNVKPYAPNHLVYLGVVTTSSNGAAGRMYVKPQNGYELDEIHNVQAQNPTLNDTLWYDNTVSPAQWKTASIPTILGYTPVQSNTAITGATNTKITYDSKGLVTSGSAATTADIADSTNKRYVTDANLTVIGNTSGTNTGDNAVNSLYSGLATSKADLASPTFTGTPSLPTGTTATTQTPLNNSTRLATTAYVEAACSVVSASNGVTVSSQDTFGTARIATVTAAQYTAFVTAGTVSATTLYFITA